MDICIVSNDKKEARFLLLELRNAGFDTSICDSFAMPALLYICDLDFINKDLPENAIGYSYDPEKARRVSLFLPRPVDAMLLRETATKLLENSRDQRRARALAVSPHTRRVFGPYGDVRLSVKELALLLALSNTKTLERSRAAEFFGDSDSNIMDVYMHYLRKKLKTVCQVDIIASKRGVGYALREDVTVNIL